MKTDSKEYKAWLEKEGNDSFNQEVSDALDEWVVSHDEDIPPRKPPPTHPRYVLFRENIHRATDRDITLARGLTLRVISTHFSCWVCRFVRGNSPYFQVGFNEGVLLSVETSAAIFQELGDPIQGGPNNPDYVEPSSPSWINW